MRFSFSLCDVKMEVAMKRAAFIPPCLQSFEKVKRRWLHARWWRMFGETQAVCRVCSAESWSRKTNISCTSRVGRRLTLQCIAVTIGDLAIE